MPRYPYLSTYGDTSAYDFAKRAYCSNKKVQKSVYRYTFMVEKKPCRTSYSLLGGIYLRVPGHHNAPFVYHIDKDRSNNIIWATYTDLDTGEKTDLYPTNQFPTYDDYLAHRETVDRNYHTGEGIAWQDVLTVLIIWIGEFYRQNEKCD
jgi:hypothetical protein